MFRKVVDPEKRVALVVARLALAVVVLPHGYFMNWFGLQKGEEIEFSLLATCLALVVTIAGDGALFAERALARRLR